MFSFQTIGTPELQHSDHMRVKDVLTSKINKPSKQRTKNWEASVKGLYYLFAFGVTDEKEWKKRTIELIKAAYKRQWVARKQSREKPHSFDAYIFSVAFTVS